MLISGEFYKGNIEENSNCEMEFFSWPEFNGKINKASGGWLLIFEAILFLTIWLEYLAIH